MLLRHNVTNGILSLLLPPLLICACSYNYTKIKVWLIVVYIPIVRTSDNNHHRRRRRIGLLLLLLLNDSVNR